MTNSASRSFIVFWSFLAMAMLCAGFAWANCTANNPQQATFQGYTVNEGFGEDTEDDHAGHNHNGLDLRTRDHPNVNAFFGGTVDTRVSSSYGHMATVTNGNIRAIYAHATPGGLAVRDRQTISAGQRLGDWSGTSGSSTGPHIHLEYQVRNSAGQWVKVDPIETQRLLDQGMNPQDPNFAAAAVNATTTRCNMTADQLGRAGAGGGRRANQYRAICDPRIRSNVSAQIDASVAKLNDYVTTNYTPPPTLSQISNNPCMSKELGRISNQFAYAPTKYAQQLTGNIIAAGGPVGGIMQNLFKAQFNSINEAAASIGGMLNFQGLASKALEGLMGSLGLGDAFSSEVCGLMVDMLLKYIQCEKPIKLPDLGRIKGSLNDLIPNNCAGAALRSGLYEAGNMSSLRTMSQQIQVAPGGTFSLTPNEQSYEDALDDDPGEE